MADEIAQKERELLHRLVAPRKDQRRRLRFERRQNIERPLPQRCALRDRDRKQVADHLDRDGCRKAGKEVMRTGAVDPVDQLVNPPDQRLFHRRKGTRVERPHHEPAHPGMERRIAEDEASGVMLEKCRAFSELGAEFALLVRTCRR